MAQAGHSFKGRRMQIFCIVLELIFDQFFFQGPGPPLILKFIYLCTRYINCLAEKVIKPGNLFFDLHPIPLTSLFFCTFMTVITRLQVFRTVTIPTFRHVVIELTPSII